MVSHGDWMNPDDFQGPNLSGNPATVEANSVYSPNFMVDIPTTVGSYNYYVIVYGQDASGNAYEWDSAQATMQVVSKSSVATPTSTANATNGGGQTLSTADYLFYIAIVAIVAMVVLALLVLLTLRRRSRAKPAAKPVSSPPPATCA